MKRAAVLVLICACKTTSSSEAHMAASAAETLDATAHTETHVEEAPSKVTTTVEEFAQCFCTLDMPPSHCACRAERGPPAEPANPSDNAVTPPVRFGGSQDSAEHGPLVKRTVTVAEIGQITTETEIDIAAKAREEARLKAEAEQKKSFDFLHSPFALLGGLVALAGVAFAAFKLLKPRILP